MINDGHHSYSYDAENRITKVDSGSTATYVYDAEGQRVQSTASGTTVNYVRDISGNVVTEFSSAGVALNRYAYLNGVLLVQYSNSTTYFVHSDHLGSTRLMTNLSGGVYDSMDYLPFGEQIAGGSGTKHKFNGKERDTESGLDNFGARYDASSMGRFMTPDWAAKPVTVPYANFGNPQSLNLYAYVENNPMTFGDPDGHQNGTAKGDAAQTTNCNAVNVKPCNQPASTTEIAKSANQSEQKKPAVSITVEGGLGWEYKGGIKGAKKLEGKVGGALKGEIEVSSQGVKVSAKVEVGGHLGPVKGPGAEAEIVTRNEHRSSRSLRRAGTRLPTA